MRDACLHWFDMYLPAIYRYRPGNGVNERLPLPEIGHVGGPIPRERGGFVLGVADGLVFYDPATGAITPFIDPRGDDGGVLDNDAKADRQGRLWIDIYHISEKEPLAALYQIDPDGQATTVVDGLIIGNGPAYAPDGCVLYLADSCAGEIYAYDVDPLSGTLGPRRLFAALPSDSGAPDGMTVDRDGGLWSAHYGGGRVARYRPDGNVDLTVSVPAPNVTSCMLGGPDLSTLYGNNARADMSPANLEAAPLSGSLLAGLPEPEFAG